MALTVHYIVRDANSRLALCSRLMAFRVIDGKHDGKNLGRIMFEILKEAKVLGMVSTLAVVTRTMCATHLCDFLYSLANLLLTMPQTVIQLWRHWRNFCKQRTFLSVDMVTISGEACTVLNPFINTN